MRFRVFVHQSFRVVDKGLVRCSGFRCRAGLPCRFCVFQEALSAMVKTKSTNPDGRMKPPPSPSPKRKGKPPSGKVKPAASASKISSRAAENRAKLKLAEKDVEISERTEDRDQEAKVCEDESDDDVDVVDVDQAILRCRKPPPKMLVKD